MSVRLGIVVPCYNEQEVLPETNFRLIELLDRLILKKLVSEDSGIFYVDDGSKDRTWSIIEDLNAQDNRVHGLKLSRNRGHQNALLAGLFGAEGDALVSIDADLQDDVSVIEDMVIKHVKEGVEVVYGVRKSRATDSGFKRVTAEWYYKFLSAMGVDIVYNHADFRLLGRRALECLSQYSEVNMFLRGVIPLIGLSMDTVFYDRAERFAGESKYPLRRMLSFALDGITSFSVVPLRVIAVLGLLVCVFSFLVILWVVFGKIFLDSVIPGWASSVIAIYFLGGIQLLSIGVLGEYISKIYLETKKRPRYFIEKVI